MKLNLEELQHIIIFLNGVSNCDVCSSARKKIEQEIANLQAIEDAKDE